MRTNKDLQRENQLLSRLKKNPGMYKELKHFLRCTNSSCLLTGTWSGEEGIQSPEDYYFLSILPGVNISVTVSILSSGYALWQAAVWILLPPWSGKQLISPKSDLITHNWDCSHYLLLLLRIYHCADTNAERRKKPQNPTKMSGFSWGTAAFTCTGLGTMPWSWIQKFQ